MPKLIACGIRLVVLGLIATHPTWADGNLEQGIEEILKTSGYQNGHWCLLVVDGKTGQVVAQRNADQLVKPASVTKLFSTAAALTELGSDFHFQTPVRRRGAIDPEGTLHGDLILVAAGDPSLGGRTGPDGTLLFTNHDHSYAGGNLDGELVPCDPLAGIESLAREIQAAKIKVVQGDVLVDDRLFPPAPATGSGPARITPIIINDNLIDVVVTPADQADVPAAVRIVPETAFVQWDAQVCTTAAGTTPRLKVVSIGPRSFQVRGQLPVGHHPVVKPFEIEHPADFARAALIEALRRKGVQVVASPLDANRVDRLPSTAEVARLPKVAEYTSPPFGAYIKVILKVSQNLHASLMPLLLATRHGQTSLSAGLRREAETLRRLGVEVGTLSLGSGAGGATRTWSRRARPSRCCGRWPPGRILRLSNPPSPSSAEMVRWPRPWPPTAPRAAMSGPRRARTL